MVRAVNEETRYSRGEEIANSVTHGLGALAGAAGLVVLEVLACRTGDPWRCVACGIYGATLVFLFTASALYHAIVPVRAKAVLRVLDHSAIYLLIAGTYTPFTLVTLRGAWGWSMFGVVWAIAAAGIALQLTLFRRFPRLEVGLYLAMGWVIVVATRPLLAALPPAGLALLAGGGLAYTGGVVFYVWRRLPYHHAIWHLFVLAGASLHYIAILRFVVPL